MGDAAALALTTAASTGPPFPFTCAYSSPLACGPLYGAAFLPSGIFGASGGINRSSTRSENHSLGLELFRKRPKAPLPCRRYGDIGFTRAPWLLSRANCAGTRAVCFALLEPLIKIGTASSAKSGVVFLCLTRLD